MIAEWRDEPAMDAAARYLLVKSGNSEFYAAKIYEELDPNYQALWQVMVDLEGCCRLTECQRFSMSGGLNQSQVERMVSYHVICEMKKEEVNND